MNVIRQRAKENFPTVLLSILGIMQALAMEILWSKIQEIDYLFELSWLSVIVWSQIVATFMGVVIVWVASLILRDLPNPLRMVRVHEHVSNREWLYVGC